MALGELQGRFRASNCHLRRICHLPASPSQNLEQRHHVLLTISCIHRSFEQVGNEIWKFRADPGIDSLLLNAL
jgi:hypothetical protein